MHKCTKDQNKVTLKIKIERALFDKTEEKVYEKNKNKFKVQGFRNGKAPLNVVKKNYGENVFFEDTLDELVKAEYIEFLTKNSDVQPVESPALAIDKFDDKVLEVTLTFATMPEISFDISKVKVAKKQVKVTEKEVGEAVARFAESHARYVEVKGEPCKMGDFVTIDFVGKIDGKEFEGGSAKDHRLELGSKSFIDTFEDQVVGMKVNQTKDVLVTFPNGYHVKNLQGKPATFTVTLNKIEKKEVPEVNDKFIADTTEFETLADYKKDVKQHLKEHEEEHAKQDLRNEIIDKLVEQLNVEIPHSMIHEEIHHMIDDFAQRLSYQGFTLDMYLEQMNKTHDEFEHDLHPQAEKSVKARLVLQKIIKDQNIKAEQSEIDAKIAEFAKAYGQETEEFKKNLGDNGLMYIENQVLTEQLYDYLETTCTIK